MFEPTADNSATTQEPATQAAAAPVATPVVNPNATETDAELDLLQQADPDEVEEELEGVKLKGKKEALDRIKSERMMQQDYTRKTMTAAEERRAFESEREAHKQNVQLHQTFLREAAQMTALDDRIAQFQKLDWNKVSAEDAQQAQKLLIEFNQLQAARGQLAGSLTQKQQQLQQAQQQEIAKLARDAQAFLQREIKDWSPQKDVELEHYARSRGINTQQLSQFMLHNPGIAVLMNEAMQYGQLRSKVQAKPKAEPPKPVTRVGGASATNTKAPSDMTPTEYAKWRQERKSRR